MVDKKAFWNEMCSAINNGNLNISSSNSLGIVGEIKTLITNNFPPEAEKDIAKRIWQFADTSPLRYKLLRKLDSIAPIDQVKNRPVSDNNNKEIKDALIEWATANTVLINKISGLL